MSWNLIGGGGIARCGIVGCGIEGCGIGECGIAGCGIEGCIAAGEVNQIGVLAAMLKCAAGVVSAESASGLGIIVGVGVVIGRGVESGGTGSLSVNRCGMTVASAMSYGADIFGVVADDAAADCRGGGETPTLSGVAGLTLPVWVLSVLSLLCPSRRRRRPRRTRASSLGARSRSSLVVRRPRRLERL